METKAPKLALGAARQSAVARAALTILMPLKQYRLSFLRKSLGSVLRQNWTQWKLCIIVEKIR